MSPKWFGNPESHVCDSSATIKEEAFFKWERIVIRDTRYRQKNSNKNIENQLAFNNIVTSFSK